MATTTVERPPSHPSHGRRPEQTGRHAAIVSATAAVLVLPAHAAWRSAVTCDDGLACLGSDVVAAAVSGVLVPLVAWVIWRVCRVPRAFLLAAAATLGAHVLADLVETARRSAEGFETELAPVPGVVHVLVAVLAGLVALAVVGLGRWRWWWRVIVVLLVAWSSFAVHARHDRLYQEHREDELRAVGVTPYLPDISDRATPSYASAWDDSLHVSYHYDPRPGEDYVFPSLRLLSATDGGCRDAARAGFGTNYLPATCRATADGFVADDGINHYVGVLRGDTMLVLESDAGAFDDEEIAEALRDAPAVGVDELVRL